MMASGKADEMGVGGILVARFGRIGGHHIVRQEAMGRTGLERDEGLVSVGPGCGITRAEADPEKTQFDDGRGMEFLLRIKPRAHLFVIGVGGPPASEQEIDIKEPAHGESSRSCLTRSGVMGGAPAGAFSR